MLSVVCFLIAVAVAVLVFLLLVVVVMFLLLLLLLLWLLLLWLLWLWWWSAQSLSAAQIAARLLPRWRQEFQQLLRAPLRSTSGQVSGTSVLDILDAGT